MADIQHTFGADLTIGAGGDLAISTGTAWGQERVLRRLLTNTGDQIWSPGYGAGLPAMIGRPANPKRIAAIAKAQMMQEGAVAATPAPTAKVVADQTGTVTLSLLYADANTGDPATLTIPVS